MKKTAFKKILAFVIGLMMVLPVIPATTISADDPEENTLKKVEISIDISGANKLFASNFNFGITHTQYYWYWGNWNTGNAAAAERARELAADLNPIGNQHIMGWGAGNPWPSKDGPMDFNDLDDRIGAYSGISSDMWLTLCQAPGWMRGTPDWSNMENKVLPQYYDDFAYLCAEIAKRYPNVSTFQVWNEFKGFWAGAPLNNWDYVEYTKFYNKVYEAVKEARPDSKIGGFYLVVEGDGSENIGINGTHNYTPLSSFQREAVSYWYENAVDADYVLIDRGVKDYHNNANFTQDNVMSLTKYFEKVTKEILEIAPLPLVYSEYYGHNPSSFGPANSNFAAAQYASIHYNMIMGAEGQEITALLWLERENDIRHALFTDTYSANGGIATPNYYAIKKLVDNFPAGTQLYKAEVASVDFAADIIGDKIEVLASDECAYVINKTNEALNVVINGDSYILDAYGVEIYEISGECEHDYEWVEYEGYKEYVCSVCGNVEKTVYLIFAEAAANAEGIVNLKENTKNIWTLTFTVEVPYEDGEIKTVEHTVEIGKNSDGIIDFGEYWLRYDIKGNGSNIKAFEIIPK